MHVRLADAIRRGKTVWQRHDEDLFLFAYEDHAARPVQEVRDLLGIPPKSDAALGAGSAPLASLEGMSETQRKVYAQRRGGTG
jgi:hypothetical protein